MCNDAEPSPRASPFSVEYTEITLEELAEYKMDKGGTKYGNPDNYQTGAMFIRYLRHFGEFLVAFEGMNHAELLECIADIQNVGALLYPKIQDELADKDLAEHDANEQLGSQEPN